MSDKELQLALAKMLPDKLWVSTEDNNAVCWEARFKHGGPEVLETEWLHVCWLVEKTLTVDEVESYRDALSEVDGLSKCPIECCVEHWSWQQRAEALCKVK